MHDTIYKNIPWLCRQTLTHKAHALKVTKVTVTFYFNGPTYMYVSTKPCKYFHHFKINDLYFILLRYTSVGIVMVHDVTLVRFTSCYINSDAGNVIPDLIDTYGTGVWHCYECSMCTEFEETRELNSLLLALLRLSCFLTVLI